jgi:hypothetical protein
MRLTGELHLAQESPESHIANEAMKGVIGLKGHQPA